jgi:hypothetical protein
MNSQLPPLLNDLVERTLASARLSGRQEEQVRAELEAHFIDGLGTGATPAALATSFGNADVAGALIGRASRRTRVARLRRLAGPMTCLSGCYLVAALLVHTAPDTPGGERLAQSAAVVARRVTEAEAALEQQRFIEGYHIAAGLRGERTYWSETASILLLDRISRSADSVPSVAWLRDSLVALEGREGLAPRRAIIEAAKPLLVDGVYGRGGRIGAHGRQLLVFSKGGTGLSLGAVLLEPLYFALPVSRQRVERLVTQISDARVAASLAAASDLASRATRGSGPP